MKKNLFGILILSILIIILTATPVMAAIRYYMTITVTEASGNTYSNQPLILTVPNSTLVSDGYISSTGLDTRASQGITELPHMLASDRTLLAAPSIDPSSSLSLKYTTGNAALDSMDIITGEGGYITVDDNATWELGDNFEIEFKKYIDATTDYPINKTGAYFIGTGNGFLTSGFYASASTAGSTISESSVKLHAGSYIRMGNRFDTAGTGKHITLGQIYLKKSGSPTGTAYFRIYNADTGSLLGTLGSLDVSTLSTSEGIISFSETPVAVPAVDIYAVVEYDGGDSSNCIYAHHTTMASGSDSWVRYTVSGGWDETGTVRCAKITYSPIYCYSNFAISSGETTIKAYADGTNYKIDINGVNKSTVALSGASVPDTADDWTITPSAYMDYYKHTVNGTLVGWYQPNAIILGTTLPDRAGSAEDGVITWGSNPDGVTATIGAIVPQGGYTTPTSTSTSFTIGIETPDTPARMYSELNMDFFGAGLLIRLADSADIELVILVYFYAFGSALILGLLAYRISMGKVKTLRGGSLTIQAVVSLIVMVYFYIAGGGVIPGWSLIPFALEATAAILKQNPQTT